MNCYDTFVCIVCGEEFALDQAAWDMDPELPSTICLDCVDDHAPTPLYARQVA